jgi:CheY-like chemotaxis protein
VTSGSIRARLCFLSRPLRTSCGGVGEGEGKAEDDDDIGGLFVFLFVREGMSLRAGVDGRDAVALFFEDDKFDLICLELEMPHLTGTDDAGLVRAANPAVPILLITASVAPGGIREAFHAGITACRSKPFGTAQLRRHVERLLAGPGRPG